MRKLSIVKWHRINPKLPGKSFAKSLETIKSETKNAVKDLHEAKMQGLDQNSVKGLDGTKM